MTPGREVALWPYGDGSREGSYYNYYYYECLPADVGRMASRVPRQFRSRAAPAADRYPGAAVLGSRAGRRQIRTVLAVAQATNAYSVSFKLLRGVVQGFTIYMANGSYMHAGSDDEPEPFAAAGAGPFDAAREDAPRERAHAEPPDTTQRCRWRGCRGGRRHRRHSGSDSDAAEGTAVRQSATTEDAADRAGAAAGSTAAAHEPRNSITPPSAGSSEVPFVEAWRAPATTSCAPTVDYRSDRSDFTPSSTPEGASTPDSQMSVSPGSRRGNKGGGTEPFPDQPFPVCVSYEERRFEYYRMRTRGGLLGLSNRKRQSPPSPAAGSPSSEGGKHHPPFSRPTPRPPRPPPY